VPLSPSSIIWYRPMGGDAGEVTAGLAESNGSLTPGLWLQSPAAGWLPRTGISSGNPYSRFEYGTTFTYTLNELVSFYCLLREWVSVRMLRWLGWFVAGSSLAASRSTETLPTSPVDTDDCVRKPTRLDSLPVGGGGKTARKKNVRSQNGYWPHSTAAFLQLHRHYSLVAVYARVCSHL